MEKDQLRSNALEHEIELGAVAEAQVAQAEGLLQVVEAIRSAQSAFTKNILIATFVGTAGAVLGICSFLYWQTVSIRDAVELAMPHIEAHDRDWKINVLKEIDWNKPPSGRAKKLRNQLTPEAQKALTRMLNAMKKDPEGWVRFTESLD